MDQERQIATVIDGAAANGYNCEVIEAKDGSVMYRLRRGTEVATCTFETAMQVIRVAERNDPKNTPHHS